MDSLPPNTKKIDLKTLKPGDRVVVETKNFPNHARRGDILIVKSIQKGSVVVEKCSRECTGSHRGNPKWPAHYLLAVPEDPITEEEAKNAVELPDIGEVEDFFKS